MPAGILSSGFTEVVEVAHLQEERDEFHNLTSHQDKIEARLVAMDAKIERLFELFAREGGDGHSSVWGSSRATSVVSSDGEDHS